MSEVVLLKRTQQLLDESPIGGKDADTKIRQLLRAEYIRRLGQYRRVIQLLAQKYGMDFDTFIGKRVIQQREYVWEVESDAMDWETAVSGIKTIEKKLGELMETSRA
jgi:hypothetical protein